MSFRSIALVSLLALILAACGAQSPPPNPSTNASASIEQMDRAGIARITMNTAPIRNMPHDHRFGRAMIGPENKAWLSDKPMRCVVIELETPRGPSATTLLFRYNAPNSYLVTTHVSGYAADVCPARMAGLQPFPELQAKFDALKRPTGAYCENLNGAMATPGVPWRCRYDGKKGFPTGRSF